MYNKRKKRRQRFLVFILRGNLLQAPKLDKKSKKGLTLSALFIKVIGFFTNSTFCVVNIRYFLVLRSIILEDILDPFQEFPCQGTIDYPVVITE